MIYLDEAIIIGHMRDDVSITIEIAFLPHGQLAAPTEGTQDVSIAIGLQQYALVDVEDQSLPCEASIGNLFQPLARNPFMLDEPICHQFFCQIIQGRAVVYGKGMVKVETNRVDLTKSQGSIGVDGALVIEDRSTNRHRDHIDPVGAGQIGSGIRPVVVALPFSIAISFSALLHLAVTLVLFSLFSRFTQTVPFRELFPVFEFTLASTACRYRIVRSISSGAR